MMGPVSFRERHAAVTIHPSGRPRISQGANTAIARAFSRSIQKSNTGFQAGRITLDDLYWTLGRITMSQRKTWKIVLFGFLAACAALSIFVGPPSPAGRYEIKLPPMPIYGGPVTNARQMHIYCQLSGGKITVISGGEIADFGSYQRVHDGWLMVFGREDMGTVITNKVEPGWYGLKVMHTGSARSQILPRCFHFWK